ncbi:MAG: hypothetical protein ACK5RV_07820 [Flavobacterium sp.]|jgi:hypothetical protein|uniref:hypothetical protein n=1 Tax=Flavobacterium sp. TaxID=239 RepID=UPI0022C3F0A5|nr:hypothetical protein [Flavobacterium sp.]MCZ8169770.1 hypothetical protein [Flavobacterium sp.]MCZ8296992.1 hypothetical protein [Flavobacterium sp.]
MDFSLALTIDSFSIGESMAQKKSVLINDLFKRINGYIKGRDYGNGIYQYLISLYVINPPKGYEHLHKDFKPKFTEYKALTNKISGEKMEIEKQFHYSVKIKGENFEEFVSANETESKKLLAQEILRSLSNLDALPKKVKDFDKERFKEDLEQFFKSEKLI